MPSYAAQIEGVIGEIALTATDFHRAVAEAKAIGRKHPGSRHVCVFDTEGGVRVTMPINRSRSSGERATEVDRR